MITFISIYSGNHMESDYLYCIYSGNQMESDYLSRYVQWESNGE